MVIANGSCNIVVNKTKKTNTVQVGTSNGGE